MSATMSTSSKKSLRGAYRTILFAVFFSQVFCSVSFAQKPVPVEVQATSVLLARARQMLEEGPPETLLSYLKELLVRLEGNQVSDAQAARAFCMFQIGVCRLQLSQYAEAASAFDTFIKEYPDDSSASLAALLSAEAYALQQNWADAEKTGRPLLKDKKFDTKRHLTVRQILSEALYRQQKWNEATVPLLEVFSLADREEVRSSAALMLVVCYAKNDDFDNLNKFLPYCGDSVRQDAGLNMALIEMADKKSAAGEYQDALKLYRMIFMKEELIAHYERQLTAIKKALDAPFVQRIGATRSEYDETIRLKKMQYDRMSEQLKGIKGGADYDLDIALRKARCYAGLQSNEVAYAMYKEIYTKAPAHALAEESRFRAFMLVLNMPQKHEDALNEGRAYLDRYPADKYTDEVTLNLMQLLLTSGKVDAAQEMGRTALGLSPEHRFMEQVRYLLAFIDFKKQNYETALEGFAEIQSRWPSGSCAEASEYWSAMCHLFMAQYDKAIEALESYLGNPAYAKKSFDEDASYRLGLAFYGKGDFPEAEKVFRRFLETYPDSGLQSEALCMLGDLRSADGGLDAALELYLKGRAAAKNRDQVNYAVFQTAKVYERQKNYQAIIKLMESYQQGPREEVNLARAGFWTGRAYKALDQYRQAVAAYMNTVTRVGNDPSDDNVDMILRELIREFRSEEGQAYKDDFTNWFTAALRQAESRNEETLVLRLQALFVYITDGTAKDLYVRKILEEPSFEKSGALPLLLLAEESLRCQDYDRVDKVYDYFSGVFKSSELLPDVLNCKLSALVQNGRYQDAVVLAEEAITRFGSQAQLGLTRKLKADALRLLKKYDAAIKMYNELFAVREWRGPLIPESLYQIGICLEAQGKNEEAFAFFQRVYVLYEGYTGWSAKSYEGSVRCLEKMGRREDVLKTLREMLSNAEIAATPEGERARTQLLRLAPSGGVK